MWRCSQWISKSSSRDPLRLAAAGKRRCRYRTAAKEKPHRTCPQTFGTNPMRLAQGWAGVWRRAIWYTTRVASFLARSASYFSSPETPHHYRYRNPRERNLKPSGKKSPLRQPARETNERSCCKHRLPQARCLRSAHPFSYRPVAAEGRFERSFRQFRTIFSNRLTTCQHTSTVVVSVT